MKNTEIEESFRKFIQELNLSKRKAKATSTQVNPQEHLMLEAALKEGLDINKALLIATDESHIGIVKLLIEKGADINKVDDNGKTALDYAQNKELEDYFIKNGGKSGVKDQNHNKSKRIKTPSYSGYSEENLPHKDFKISKTENDIYQALLEQDKKYSKLDPKEEFLSPKLKINKAEAFLDYLIGSRDQNALNELKNTLNKHRGKSLSSFLGLKTKSTQILNKYLKEKSK
jgi:ankyrin repeat protein